MTKRGEGVRVTTWLHRLIVRQIDAIVATGEFNSRSAILQEALRDWLAMRKEKIGEVEKSFKE